MKKPLKIDVITIFPQMLNGFLRESMMKRAEAAGLVEFNVINLRDFTTDKHNTTDDRPFGGGPGMVMKPEPIFAAFDAEQLWDAHKVYLSPQGTPLTHALACRLAEQPRLALLCGHYEGVDQRVLDEMDAEVSIGDYVLSNGAIAAVVLVDVVVRLLPGVLGNAESARTDSFADGLLEYPQYTRPAEFRARNVPEVLLSGDHAAIERWRRAQAEERTRARRPDLLRRKPRGN